MSAQKSCKSKSASAALAVASCAISSIFHYVTKMKCGTMSENIQGACEGVYRRLKLTIFRPKLDFRLSLEIVLSEENGGQIRSSCGVPEKRTRKGTQL
eukprot:IDg5623t1